MGVIGVGGWGWYRCGRVVVGGMGMGGGWVVWVCEGWRVVWCGRGWWYGYGGGGGWYGLWKGWWVVWEGWWVVSAIGVERMVGGMGVGVVVGGMRYPPHTKDYDDVLFYLY